MDAAVTLDVVDDGIGFDTSAPVPATPAISGSGGFGLRSMTSRAAELGAIFTVESQPGRGTAVSVLFDRSAAAAPPATTGRPA